MTWFKVDDKLHSHRKTYRAGVEAMGLWVVAGSWCADHPSNGFIPSYVVAHLDPNGWQEHAKRLTDAGFWTEAVVDGEKGWLFHDWLDMQPSKEKVLRDRRSNARRQALFRNEALRDAVRDRDRDQCRYCAIKVRWQDRRSGQGGTYDHVDPEGGNTFENLVVACRSCNSRKQNRPLESCGMTLLPVPQNVTSYVSVNTQPPTRPPLKGEGSAREPRAPVSAAEDEVLDHETAMAKIRAINSRSRRRSQPS